MMLYPYESDSAGNAGGQVMLAVDVVRHIYGKSLHRVLAMDATCPSFIELVDYFDLCPVLVCSKPPKNDEERYRGEIETMMLTLTTLSSC